MVHPGKTLTRIGGIALATYLLCDAIGHGPLNRWLASRLTPASATVVARVRGHPITRGQLDRALSEHLWREGKTLESLAPATRLTARTAALDELIDGELLRVMATAEAPPPQVSDAEIQQRLQRFRERFATPEDMTRAMTSQGIASERDLGLRLAAQLQQEKFLESRVGPRVRVTDGEARQWWSEHRRDLMNPPRADVRHVFIATLECPPDVAKAKLAAALADLTAGKKNFATLAHELSEDPATKDHGGALGWMSRNRLPADFAAALFALAPNHPSLVRSSLGWHLVEVTNRQPATERSFEQAKPEIIAALDAVNRRQAIAEFRADLRRQQNPNIQIERLLIAD